MTLILMCMMTAVLSYNDRCIEIYDGRWICIMTIVLSCMMTIGSELYEIVGDVVYPVGKSNIRVHHTRQPKVCKVATALGSVETRGKHIQQRVRQTEQRNSIDILQVLQN